MPSPFPSLFRDIWNGKTALLLLYFLTPIFAGAEGTANLSLSPASGTYGVGKTFTVQIMVDSPDAFNAVSAKLTYDKTLLSVQGISKNNSAFVMWPDEPVYSNPDGTIAFGGGNTTQLSGKKTLLSVTLKAIKEGSAEVAFTTGMVTAADGKGTDIVGTKTGATFTISGKAETEPPPTQGNPGDENATLIPKPDAPIIISKTHPDENAYSNAPRVKFEWELPVDVTIVRMSLDKKEKVDPTTNYDPAVSEKEFDLPEDGTMYFHLRYRNEAGLGPTAHRRILIDKTPPPPFDLTITPDASSTDVLFEFSATDTLSGLAGYDLSLDGGNPIKISLLDATGGKYTLTGQTPGNHTATLRAIDKAGNTTSAEGKFVVSGELPGAKPAGGEDEPKPTDWRLIGEIALIALIVFLVSYLFYERRSFGHEKFLAKREADELRNNMANIFSALREEIGEQASRLFQKPNPSAQDREIMEGINSAVDLSEELISKEIEDVRKLLS